jgi:hypothetical protein
MKPVSMIIVALVFGVTTASAQVTQPKYLVSAGGAHSAAGNLTLSSNLGDVIVGHSVAGTQDVWHGFYAPLSGSVVGVADARATFAPQIASWPNPAVRAATIQFGLGETDPDVRIEVFDIRGALIRSIAHGAFPAGVHSLRWDLRSGAGQIVPTGLYFIRLHGGTISRSTRMIVAR